MAEMIAFSFSTAIGGPETTAIKCRGSAKSSLFQLLIRSNIHSTRVYGGNKPLLQVIKLLREHTLITRPIPWPRFSKGTASPRHGSPWTEDQHPGTLGVHRHPDSSNQTPPLPLVLLRCLGGPHMWQSYTASSLGQLGITLPKDSGHVERMNRSTASWAESSNASGVSSPLPLLLI